MVGAVSTSGMVTAAQVRSQEGIRISLNEQKSAMGVVLPKCWAIWLIFAPRG